MTNIFNWNFKFCQIIIVLTCWISQSDAQCSQDINGVYRFGSECGFLCHCLKDEQCDVITGDCPSGCGFEWVGPGCQHKNIALEGYERHLDNIQPHRYADLANDRDLSTCSHTGGEDTTRIVNPFWRFWRPFNFTLRQIEILTLDNKRRYFDGFTVIVQYVPDANKEENNYNPALSQICYTHTNTSLESVSLTVTCEHAYSGNQVKIQLGRRNTQLVLCDVRIYGDCAENVCTYDCNKLCFCKNVTTNDKVSGMCSNGCTGRWSGKDGACDRKCAVDKWGEMCDIQCGHCRNNATCDVVTGKCPSGCEDGYKDTQLCNTVCETGKWGVNCTNVCGMCLTGTCNHTDGICMDGNRCKAGYTSYPWCNQVCETGKWGVNCTNVCGMCLTGTCNHTDGICMEGNRCKAGYTSYPWCNQECAVDKWGEMCDIQCGHCRNNATCDVVTGKCPSGCEDGYKDTQLCNTVCETGKWGVNCTNVCGMCLTGTCNHTDGICMEGNRCKAGYTSYPWCNQVCETGKWGVNCTNVCGMCLTGTCNHTDGICMEGNRCKAGYTSYPWCNQECEDWLYGLKCQSYCSQNCKNNVPCRKTDGQCPDGCARGYIGNECTENCPVGYHGYDCEEKCSANCAGEEVDCDKAYGTCLAGCNPGWTGRTCQEEEPAETAEAMTAVIAVVAGVGTAIIVVIILGIVAILRYLRRTRKSSYENKHENRENHGMAMSNISSKGARQTDKSGNTYETLQDGNADEHQYELPDPTHRF